MTTTKSTLAALLTCEADDSAWTEFVETYQPLLVAMAIRLGIGAGDAVDVAQQTLLEFVRDLRAGRFNPSRGALRNWLLAISDHRIRDHQRSRIRLDETASLSSAHDSREVAQLEQIWETEERRNLLERAMQRLHAQTNLDERTVRAFELAVLHGVPTEAVAQECAMTCAEVYVARSRAAAKLREIVRELDAVSDTREAAGAPPTLAHAR